MLNHIGAFAVEAMLFEVSATPKPGLVDRKNNGAHKDMDFFTFMSSAAALRGAFDAFAATGYAHRMESVATLLPELQGIGVKAERQMFELTQGVNTHKGMIFSLGVLCGAAGWLADREVPTVERLCLLAAEMCDGLCEQQYAKLNGKKQLTKGEAMYLKYGVTGVRGEAESGFATVREIAMPAYYSLRAEGYSINDVLVGTLLVLLAGAHDTNILGRHDMETLHSVQREAQQVLDAGGIRTEEGRAAVQALDEDFIRRWISPGGSADLIAVTHFLYRITSTSKTQENRPLVLK